LTESAYNRSTNQSACKLSRNSTILHTFNDNKEAFAPLSRRNSNALSTLQAKVSTTIAVLDKITFNNIPQVKKSEMRAKVARNFMNAGKYTENVEEL
jgi:hypothetical protein